MKQLWNVLAFVVVAGCIPPQSSEAPMYVQPNTPAYNSGAPGQGTVETPGFNSSQVIVNGVALSNSDAQQARIPVGRYWYDGRSGLWGVEGMPLQGQIQPGLQIGSLSANASRGTTNVFVNGRNLPYQEVVWLQQTLLTQVMPGQYWLDAQGNMGIAGGPALVNLYVAAQAQGGNGGGGNNGGDNFWSSRGGSRGNESGGAGYVCTGGTCATYGM